MHKVRANKHCKALTFKPGDVVWLHLRKERFPSQRINKLIPRGYGPFKVLDKVNDNACKLEFPGDMGVSLTFNVGDPTSYHDDKDDRDDLKANHNQEGDDEANSMPILVQESTQVLLSAQKLHHEGLSPCTDLELQFKVHLKPLESITLLF